MIATMPETNLSQSPGSIGRPATSADVKEQIRDGYAKDGKSYEQLAVDFGLSYNTIRAIVKGLKRASDAGT